MSTNEPLISDRSGLTSVRSYLLIAGDSEAHPIMHLGVLRGDKGLDESVGALGVEGEGVTQRGQLRTFLHKRLLQPVSSGVEVLLEEKKKDGQKFINTKGKLCLCSRQITCKNHKIRTSKTSFFA